ncbi:hypothetical protein EVAR_82850_1 [Eumeta japonica]|uniref:Uncharacterized protein n=1 Tax=Eumeta variegata TaxID=151549 RepID=A0A4C1V419_EUMVA|nr:hypothetical protein EVAR_82850_1 [Eumeta japonica]
MTRRVVAAMEILENLRVFLKTAQRKTRGTRDASAGRARGRRANAGGARAPGGEREIAPCIVSVLAELLSTQNRNTENRLCMHLCIIETGRYYKKRRVFNYVGM